MSSIDDLLKISSWIVVRLPEADQQFVRHLREGWFTRYKPDEINSRTAVLLLYIAENLSNGQRKIEEYKYQVGEHLFSPEELKRESNKLSRGLLSKPHAECLKELSRNIRFKQPVSSHTLWKLREIYDLLQKPATTTQPDAIDALSPKSSQEARLYFRRAILAALNEGPRKGVTIYDMQVLRENCANKKINLGQIYRELIQTTTYSGSPRIPSLYKTAFDRLEEFLLKADPAKYEFVNPFRLRLKAKDTSVTRSQESSDPQHYQQSSLETR